MKAALLCAAFLVAASPAFAQDGQVITKENLDAIVQGVMALANVPPEIQKQHDDVAKDLGRLSSKMVDLAVPDSPAFTVLGLTPEDIARPTTGRALAASLLSGIDRHGVLQSGVAIDTLPYLALAGPLLTLDAYRANTVVRVVARTQLSLATSKASDADDKAMRAAIGIRVTILDYGDPRADMTLDRCVGDAIDLPAPPAAVIPPLPDRLDAASLAAWQQQVVRAKQAIAEYEGRVSAWKTTSAEKVRACREDARKRAWNATKWIAAVAPAWISPTGAVGDLASSGAGVWTTFGYGFEGLPGLERSAQLLLHARYRNNETVADPADATRQITRDSRLLGVQFRAGTADSTVAAEAMFERLMPDAASATSDRRYSVGYEWRLAPNLWLGVALGSGSAPVGQEKKGGFLLSSLKWGFEGAPSLAVPQ